MTQCPSTAQVMPGGAIIRCELELGHDEPTPYWLSLTGRHYGIRPSNASGEVKYEPGTPHRHVLEWSNPEGVVIDPELYDPDETFDLEVDIDPLVEASHVPAGLCGAVCCSSCGEACTLTPHGIEVNHSWQH